MHDLFRSYSVVKGLFVVLCPTIFFSFFHGSPFIRQNEQVIDFWNKYHIILFNSGFLTEEIGDCFYKHSYT
jgi:hypothetical protein